MKEVVIVDSVRTPIGSLGGTLKDMTADILASEVMKALLKRNKLDPKLIDEVILGQAKQSADISNIARVASIRAGISLEVPGYTVHRQCGSGLQVIHNAAQQIKSGDATIVLCGGVESMSTAPYYVNGVRFGVKSGNVQLKDSNTASQPGSQPYETYGDLTMGMTAENVAEKYGITRLEQDEFALQSQVRAATAIEQGKFKEETVPLIIQQRKNTIVFEEDEYPRDTSIEALNKLKPVFKSGGTVTAGNASGRNDGASAVLIMSKEKAMELGYKKGFKVVSYASAGVDPNYMGLGPIPATKKALEKADLSIEDMDIIELNEAFAAQALAFYKEFGLDPKLEKVNPNGGAISLGHPIGATGSILMTKLIHELERIHGRYGMVTLCIAGGLGITTIVERIVLSNHQ